MVRAKFLMALTGAGLLVFVIMHMLGNLQIYLGREALNDYAALLKSMPLLLWTARIGLLAIFTVHLALAFYLKQKNRLARPRGYAVNDPVDTSLASRTMLTSGLVILAFVIYHLLHFTLGYVGGETHDLVDDLGRHDVYSMVVLGFQNVGISAAYIIAMLFLGLHLSHAASSVFQTFGIASSGTRTLLHRLGLGLTWLIVVGNVSIPASVLLGFVQLPASGNV